MYRYLIMKNCWELSPDARPSFALVVTSLSSLLELMADYMDFFTLSNPTATVNTPPPSAPPLVLKVDEDNGSDSGAD